MGWDLTPERMKLIEANLNVYIAVKLNEEGKMV